MTRTRVCGLMLVFALGCHKDKDKDVADQPGMPTPAGGVGQFTIKGDDGSVVTFGKGGFTAKSKDGTSVVAGEGGLVAQGKDGTTTISGDGKNMVVRGPNGETITVDSEHQVSTIKSKDGTFTMGASAEGFPLPVFAGATVTASMHDEKHGSFTMNAMVAASAEDVANHYEKALKEKGFSVKRKQTSVPNMKIINLDGKNGNIKATAVAMEMSDGTPGAPASTQISVSWEDKH